MQSNDKFFLGKTIIVVHNFMELEKIKDVSERIDKDIKNCFVV